MKSAKRKMNRTMINRLTFFVLFFISSILDAQSNKRALVITIGDYPINFSKNQISFEYHQDLDTQILENVNMSATSLSDLRERCMRVPMDLKLDS